LVEGKSDVSIEMAQRLSLGLHGTAEFWVNMQRNYDLWKARNNTYKKVDRKWLTTRMASSSRPDRPATRKRAKRKAQKKTAA
jgi:plasmid maintenance system antidote protein VapI